jgi:voltage-gated potassium channel Kch
LVASRWLLPALFRSVAKQPELLLAASLAWCFAVSGGSSYVGLSREMGALLAGVSLCAMPYNLDVIAKVISIRDFFVTLFFVALGMQIPAPTPAVIGWALLASVFLWTTRFVSIVPLLRALRLGNRTSLLPAINLAQMSEFSLVIASLGLAKGQVSPGILSILILVFVITSVASTYLIDQNDQLVRWLNQLLLKMGLTDIGSGIEPAAPQSAEKHDRVVLLGFYHEASGLLHEWERGAKKQLLERLLVIDFNPEVHGELNRRGIDCIYGDLANMDTLSHAGLNQAKLIVLTIPDSALRGTTNRRLLLQARRLNQRAEIVATAERVHQALDLYRDGADYVFVTHLHSARERAEIIETGLRADLKIARRYHVAELQQRNEVLQ